jgi:hypothetical protein
MGIKLHKPEEIVRNRPMNLLCRRRGQPVTLRSELNATAKARRFD